MTTFVLSEISTHPVRVWDPDRVENDLPNDDAVWKKLKCISTKPSTRLFSL